tara:strand:+ start:63 stop:560 length:498 start_codon:yes stop_codon:yes gene_type:complete
MNIRIGHGIDIHQLKKNIPFILGGIQIKSSIGIKGHSDGDVLLHALVDALLGSLSLGDIGTYFPSNSSKWKNCNSDIFLKETIKKVHGLNYKIANVDITVLLQEPYIKPYINQIKTNLSNLMQLNLEQISIKATTTDGLGFVGQKKGILSTASVLIYKDINESSH